jgi:hypothetical protein
MEPVEAWEYGGTDAWQRFGFMMLKQIIAFGNPAILGI